MARHHDRRRRRYRVPTGGVHREVVEPARLVFTWAEPGETDPNRTALITISLADLGGKTEMTFHQAGPADANSEVRASMHDGWSQTLVARTALLAKEKAATRAKDALNAERRELPMVRVEKDYVFDSTEGKRSLLDLFDGRRQLIVYHAMWLFGDDQLCPSCSLLIDGLPHLSRLHARNTTLTVVSRGPLEKLREYWQRMGWTVPVVSSAGSDFNWDFNVTVDPSVRPAEYYFAPMDGDWAGELPGTSVFLRDGDTVFHTYSSYARGGDVQIGAYTYLDLTPLGRQEDWEQPPGRSDGPFMSWVRRHDEYDLRPPSAHRGRAAPAVRAGYQRGCHARARRRDQPARRPRAGQCPARCQPRPADRR